MEKGTSRNETGARKRASGIGVLHQRLWWMELARGIFTFTFGLLFLSARSFAPRLFMYSLGTYEILRTYGCTELLDPAKEYIPNDWYDALPGASYTIEQYPAIAVSLHRQSRHEIATREIALAIPTRMMGAPPPWLEHRWRAWEELTLVWEMMIGHILTLWTSGTRLIARHWRNRASQHNMAHWQGQLALRERTNLEVHSATKDPPDP